MDPANKADTNENDETDNKGSEGNNNKATATTEHQRPYH
jgi:hypothetical protein